MQGASGSGLIGPVCIPIPHAPPGSRPLDIILSMQRFDHLGIHRHVQSGDPLPGGEQCLVPIHIVHIQVFQEHIQPLLRLTIAELAAVAGDEGIAGLFVPFWEVGGIIFQLLHGPAAEFPLRFS